MALNQTTLKCRNCVKNVNDKLESARHNKQPLILLQKVIAAQARKTSRWWKSDSTEVWPRQGPPDLFWHQRILSARASRPSIEQ